MNELICKYCGKECKNKNSLAQHEIRCKYNPNRISLEYLKYRDQTNIKRNPSNQFIKAKKLGLPIPKVSEETKIKISKVWKGRKHSEESKRKISKEMQRIVRENPESYSASNVNGRVKKVEYNGIILDSKWEVIVAKYLDSNNIEWTRPKIGFEYTYNETNKIYYPDFYLPKYDTYIEVKGYERDKDKYKWQSVNNLIVIKQKEIRDIQLNNYNILDILNYKGS
jgi:extradiol dioxygenase family protein